jgi:hypothetical protein
LADYEAGRRKPVVRSAWAEPAPANGDVVWIQGYEFTVEGVREYPGTLTDPPLCRFVGRLTDNPRNDAIRGTAYNGGVYGWRTA